MCDHGQRIGQKLTMIIFWYLIFDLFCTTFDANSFYIINEDKFRHNFRDTVDLMCSWSPGIETIDHYRCQNLALVRSSFLNRVFEIDVEFRNMNDLSNIVKWLYQDNFKPAYFFRKRFCAHKNTNKATFTNKTKLSKH